jgi:hypothetical protein
MGSSRGCRWARHILLKPARLPTEPLQITTQPSNRPTAKPPDCRYDMLVDTVDSPKHRAARAHALACMGCMEEALQDCESAVAGDPQVHMAGGAWQTLLHGAGSVLLRGPPTHLSTRPHLRGPNPSAFFQTVPTGSLARLPATPAPVPHPNRHAAPPGRKEGRTFQRRDRQPPAVSTSQLRTINTSLRFMTCFSLYDLLFRPTVLGPWPQPPCRTAWAGRRTGCTL